MPTIFLPRATRRKLEYREQGRCSEEVEPGTRNSRLTHVRGIRDVSYPSSRT